MQVVKKQRGLSFLGFVIVLCVLGVFAFIGMKLWPAYYEYYNVVGAIEAIRKDPGSARWTPAEVWKSLEKRMYINYVDERYVGKRNFVIKRQNGKLTITVKYERREPMVYNLDYVAKFEKTVVLGAATGAD